MRAKLWIDGRMVPVVRVGVEWVLLEGSGIHKAGELFIGYVSKLLGAVVVTRWVPGVSC